MSIEVNGGALFLDCVSAGEGKVSLRFSYPDGAVKDTYVFSASAAAALARRLESTPPRHEREPVQLSGDWEP